MRTRQASSLAVRMDDDELLPHQGATGSAAPGARRRASARRSAIVGGGLAGLATALSLAERGRTSVLIEARTIGAGASGRNGGMVSAGFAAPTRLLERAAGPEAARSLMRLSREAMELIRARIERHAIACEPVSGVVIASWFDDGEALAAEVAEYNTRYGHAARVLDRATAARDFPSPRYWDGMFDPEGFHLDPFALCRGYAARRRGAWARACSRTARPPACGASRGGWRVTTPRGRGHRRSGGPVPERLPAAAAAGAGARDLAGVHLHHRHRTAHRRACRGDPRTLCRLRQPLRHRLLPPAAGRAAALGRSDQHAGAAARSRRPDAARSRPGLPAARRRRGRPCLVGPDGLRPPQDAADPRAGAGPVGQQLLRRPRPQHHHAGRRAGGLGRSRRATAAGGCWRRSRRAGSAAPSARWRRRRSTAAPGCRTPRAPTGTGVGHGDRLPQPDRRTGRTQDTLSARHVPARARWPRGFA